MVDYKNDAKLIQEAYGSNHMLFLDCAGYSQLYINEAASGGTVKFRGKFQEANAENKNKRKYPFDVLDSNVKRLMETIHARGLVGELDHPTDSIIHFEKASHIITDLWWEGNVLMGEGEILPTPHGKILENLIRSGVRIGISSRGVGNGTTDRSGILVIGESYKLITFDAVADPSTYAAYQKIVDGNKAESVETQRVNTKSEEEYDQNIKKNDQSSINTCNENALVAYWARVIQNHKNRILTENILREVRTNG